MAAVVVAPLLTLAEALALGTDVVAEHGAENEVFFGSELVERTVDNHADGIQALLLSEEKVHMRQFFYLAIMDSPEIIYFYAIYHLFCLNI